MSLKRVNKLIEQSISTFSLDLSGSVVLTEAASNYYMFTPLIAARAGAKKVLALTRDSRFGTAQSIQTNLMDLAHQWNLNRTISVITDRNDDRIGHADIITNLGFVRPLDLKFLKRLKPTAVIPLMWETWEFRSEDLDLNACRDLGIAVLGTNEHHAHLNTFQHIGTLALKLLFSLDIEITGSKIIILGSGEFGDIVRYRLIQTGAEAELIDTGKADALTISKHSDMFQSADALVIAEHHHRNQLIGPNGYISPQTLATLNPGLSIAHICGNVDRGSLRQSGIECMPDTFAPPGYMSVATDYVGPKPLIDLHTAGLKVGECLFHVRKNGLEAFEAEMQVLRACDLAQGFSGYHVQPQIIK